MTGDMRIPSGSGGRMVLHGNTRRSMLQPSSHSDIVLWSMCIILDSGQVPRKAKVVSRN
jgi:hypothetical protein